MDTPFDFLKLLFYFLVFPGFVFLSVGGMFVSWLDRKITARLQWRVGPPLLQPMYDMRKLLAKEIMLPEGANIPLFVLAPFIALLATVIISDILVLALLEPAGGFSGDLIIVFYLLVVPALAGILGASASHNPLASLGASREMKLILSYELPLVLGVLVPVIQSGSLTMGDIIAYQHAAGPIAGSLSGFIASAVALICVHGKMGLVPFDLAEAETELAAGSQIEYSGPLLAVWKLSRMMLLVIGPLFLITLFWPGGGAFAVALKYLAIFAVSIVIRNTNPRLRIDQAMRFFWGPVTVAGLLAVGLALAGY